MSRSVLLFSAFCILLGVNAAAQQVPLRVQDSSGIPIANASIEIRSGKSVQSIRTDQTGQYAWQCQPGARLIVSVIGFESQSVSVENCTSPLVLKLAPATVHTTLNVVLTDPGVATTATASSTATEIDRTAARTVFDAVEDLSPSVYVTRRGVMGYGISTNGTGGVSIRGISGSPNTDVLIVMNGRPDYQGEMGHPLPDFYDLSGVGSIRVIEGPSSVLYGTNAMGGVVEIEPRTPAKAHEFELTSSLGSYMTGQHRFSAGIREGRGVYNLAASVNHTNGDRTQSGFRSQNVSLGTSYTLNNLWKLSLDGNYGHFMVDDPGPITAPLRGSYAAVGRGGFSVDLANATNRLNGYTRMYSTYGHNFISDGFRSVDRITGGRVYQSLLLPKNVSVNFGTDVVNYGGTARTATNPDAYGGDHQITDAAGFVRGRWVPVSGVMLNAGIRYQSNSQFGDLAVPEAGLSWMVTNRLTCSVSGGEGFRNPTLRELYLFPGPNPDLKPVRMWSGETSLQYRVSSSLVASTTFYYAHLRNQMATTGYWPNMLVVNQGKANNRGVETSLRWKIQRRISGTAGYAYLHSSNLQPLVPRNKITLTMDVDLKKAMLYAGVQCIGRRYTSSAHTTELAGYAVATMKLSVPIQQNVSVFATVDNLLNRDYQVLSGYPMPKVNGAGGLSIRF